MMFPKPNHKRRAPKKAERGKFSERTAEMIVERDNGLCQECGAIGSEIHHVKFKSQGGRGVFTNGMLVCPSCHRKIHQSKYFTNKWIDKFRSMYGEQFYKDMYDIN